MPDGGWVDTVPVTVDAPDPVAAAVAALAAHDAACNLARYECEARRVLAAAWRRALRGAGRAADPAAT